MAYLCAVANMQSDQWIATHSVLVDTSVHTMQLLAGGDNQNDKL